MTKLRQGARVRIYRNPDAPADETPPPPGVWMVLSHAPTGPTHWWLMAHDAEARSWGAAHPREITSGCIVQPGNRLDLVNVARL